VRNSFELKGSIFNVISSALDHNDAILRESFSLAMGDFFRSVRISRTELAVSGDNISEYIYQRFWDILNAYQALQKKAGVATKVYVSHSASLAVWDKNGVLAQKQADFVTNGGIIYRIIIRNKSSKDNDSRYKEIVQSMKSQNLHVHLLDLRAKDRPTEIHDYLIVTINGEKYVFVWEADWNSNSHFFGDIEASRLLIGEGEFDHFRYRWTRLLEVAEEYKDNQNISFDDWRIKI
jgi:hypothetical protein